MVVYLYGFVIGGMSFISCINMDVVLEIRKKKRQIENLNSCFDNFLVLI